MPNEHDPLLDPLDLEAVERDIRINELHERLGDRGATFHVSEDCPPEAHEQFLRNMEHFENGPLSSHFEQLAGAGVGLPPPDSLDDAALSAKLWEVINALAERDTFLYHTDHMSDRQLYEHLWNDTLREETTIMPPGSGWACHLDLISSGSDEDIQNGLRYYDTEEQRRHWARDFPDLAIPPHEDPPFDRDRRLPRAGPDAAETDEGDDE